MGVAGQPHTQALAQLQANDPESVLVLPLAMPVAENSDREVVHDFDHGRFVRSRQVSWMVSVARAPQV